MREQMQAQTEESGPEHRLRQRRDVARPGWHIDPSLRAQVLDHRGDIVRMEIGKPRRWRFNRRSKLACTKSGEPGAQPGKRNSIAIRARERLQVCLPLCGFGANAHQENLFIANLLRADRVIE
ncbi:MAG: hypothetical protein ACREVG_13535 [Burkholderiales bacterium]